MSRRRYAVQPARSIPLYFGNPAGAAGSRGEQLRADAMASGLIGYIDTPHQGNVRPGRVAWCADNGCFNDASFTEAGWIAFLEQNAHAAASCMFATVPDVVGDHDATLARSLPWFAAVRDLGYRPAFVAQDGFDAETTPWDLFDCLFIGGSDDFKMGPAGAEAIAEAQARGKWVHVGRVNSEVRYRYFAGLGVDSCDGTFLIKGNVNEGENVERLVGWVTGLIADVDDRIAAGVELGELPTVHVCAWTAGAARQASMSVLGGVEQVA